VSARSLYEAVGPRVAVVICAYTEKRWQDLTAAVSSVLTQLPPPDEVILVVDHNDLLLQRAQHEWRGRITVVANCHARGLSGARNTGNESTTADIVAFLDDDAAAEPGWLACLTSAFEDAAVVGAGGTVTPKENVALPPWWPSEFNWVIGCSWTGLPTSATDVRNVIGCNMAFRRDPMVAAGGFADGIGRVGSLPVGCEETDLCIRLRVDGGRIRYLPSAHVEHNVDAGRVTARNFARRCFAEGVSKAIVSRRNGRGTGLESERAYAGRVLPRAVIRSLGAAAPARATAIVAGLAITASGFAWGWLRGATA
jgi:GT2 family glycosyltransferase